MLIMLADRIPYQWVMRRSLIAISGYGDISDNIS